MNLAFYNLLKMFLIRLHGWHLGGNSEAPEDEEDEAK